MNPPPGQAGIRALLAFAARPNRPLTLKLYLALRLLAATKRAGCG